MLEIHEDDFVFFAHNISWVNIKLQTANIQLAIIFVLIFIWKVKGRRGTWMKPLLPCYADAIATWRTCASTHVPIMSNFFPIDFPACVYMQILFENGNLMVIVMNVDLADQKSRRDGSAREPEKRGLFRCLGVIGFHEKKWFGGNMIIFSLCFSSYTGESSATRRQGTPPTHIIRRFFTSDKQAIWLSLRLFEENMFLHHTPGSPTSGRKVDNPWALDTAVMHLSILRLRGWATVCKLGVWCIHQPQMLADLQPEMPVIH